MICALCDVQLTPRRAVVLDGKRFCSACRDRHIGNLNNLTDAVDVDEDELADYHVAVLGARAAGQPEPEHPADLARKTKKKLKQLAAIVETTAAPASTEVVLQ